MRHVLSADMFGPVPPWSQWMQTPELRLKIDPKYTWIYWDRKSQPHRLFSLWHRWIFALLSCGEVWVWGSSRRHFRGPCAHLELWALAHTQQGQAWKKDLPSMKSHVSHGQEWWICVPDWSDSNGEKVHLLQWLLMARFGLYSLNQIWCLLRDSDLVPPMSHILCLFRVTFGVPQRVTFDVPLESQLVSQESHMWFHLLAQYWGFCEQWLLAGSQGDIVLHHYPSFGEE